jgi:hypothetical protein
MEIYPTSPAADQSYALFTAASIVATAAPQAAPALVIHHATATRRQSFLGICEAYTISNKSQ